MYSYKVWTKGKLDFKFIIFEVMSINWENK